VENNPRHQDVAWGPGGETILFARYEGLYLTRIGSTELELLLECEWQCWSVAWSPDGEKIAFVEEDVGLAGRVEEDVTYLKILDTADGTFRVLLTLHSMAEPVWSPDSAKLAFLGTLSQENRGGLYTLDLDSGELRLIVPNPGPTGITRITHMEVPMSWSPDGSQIAYAWIVEDSSDIYYNEIRVVDVVTLESMTIWKEEDPIRLLSGPDWRGEP
jgi:Tol biopolymer transport system component